MTKQIAYTYSDVLIEPKYSEIRSRSTDVDIKSKIGKVELKIPVISSNMKTITGSKMASLIYKLGGLGILHRFCTIEDNVKMFIEATSKAIHPTPPTHGGIGVSIGVKEEDKERFEKLYEAGARIFCIDVAHGHHVLVKEMLSWMRNQRFYFSDENNGSLTVIAGNVATPSGYAALRDWGADAVKVGIGPSNVCRTRYNTGVGVPQLYALERIYTEMSNSLHPISIIADGGINHVGDICKAMKFSDAVMLGSMIAGTSETPGDVFRNEQNEFYKVYGGSASGENKGENRFVEGIVKTVKFKGHVKYILREIEQGLKSSFSYVGATNLEEFQRKCEFNLISGGSRMESKI